MKSPGEWSEPGQAPEFDECTIVLRGKLQLNSKEGLREVSAGQTVIALAREWIQYSTPDPEGAEYIAVCMPAFAPELVHWDGK